MISKKILTQKIDLQKVKVVTILLLFSLLGLATLVVSGWFGFRQWQLSKTISPFEARSETPEIDIERFVTVSEELSGRSLVEEQPPATPSAQAVGNPEPFGP